MPRCASSSFLFLPFRCAWIRFQNSFYVRFCYFEPRKNVHGLFPRFTFSSFRSLPDSILCLRHLLLHFVSPRPRVANPFSNSIEFVILPDRGRAHVNTIGAPSARNSKHSRAFEVRKPGARVQINRARLFRVDGFPRPFSRRDAARGLFSEIGVVETSHFFYGRKACTAARRWRLKDRDDIDIGHPENDSRTKERLFGRRAVCLFSTGITYPRETVLYEMFGNYIWNIHRRI